MKMVPKKKWSEVLEIRSGRNQTDVLDENGSYPIYGSGGNIMGYSNDYICEENTTIIGRKGSINNPILIKEKFWNVDTAFGLHALEGLNKYYLNYFCQSYDFTQLDKGSGRPSLVKSDLLKIEMPVPSIREQQQIVDILDEAFAAINQAKANIEKNIANAKELFQSKLNEIFSQKGDGWEQNRFSDLFKLKSGDGLTAKDMVDGPYPVYGGNGISGYHDTFNMDGEYLIIGRVGALCGNVRHLNEQFWLTDNAFQISEYKADFDLEFLCLLLNYVDLRCYARQAAQPVISNSSLKDIVIPYPKGLSTQRSLAENLNQLQVELVKIQNTFELKLSELEELKKTILQKAFKGELTNNILVDELH